MYIMKNIYVEKVKDAECEDIFSIQGPGQAMYTLMKVK